MSQIQRIVSRGCLILKLGLIIILLDVRVYFLNSLYLLVFLLFSFSFFFKLQFILYVWCIQPV